MFFNKEKRQTFSLRKYKDGRTDSKLIGSTIVMLGIGALVVSSPVFASEQGTVSSNVTPLVNHVVNDKAENPSAVIATLDKSQLSSYITEISTNLTNGKYANKTDESVSLLRAGLSEAESVLGNAKTQEELKSAYTKLVTIVNAKLQNKVVEKPSVLAPTKPVEVDKKEDTTVVTETKLEGSTVDKTADEKVDKAKPENKSGSKDERNGKPMETGSGFRSATEGYTYETTEKRHENGEFATATGKSYRVLDSNSNYKLYVQGYQSENTDRPSSGNETPATGGRTDIPLSKTEAEKLRRESILWDGLIRPTGKQNNNSVNRRDDKALERYLTTLKGIGDKRYGAGGSYEFLTTEIYGYTYEQGEHYVYVKDVKKRFSLSQEAKDAGYRIDNIELSNLAPGLGYNEKTDSIEGYISSSIQNGVYDMRYDVTIRKPDDTTSKYSFANLTAGWMGW